MIGLENQCLLREHDVSFKQVISALLIHCLLLPLGLSGAFGDWLDYLKFFFARLLTYLLRSHAK